jgi:hypothetical protein
LIARRFTPPPGLRRHVLLASLAAGLIACDAEVDNTARQPAAPAPAMADKPWLDMHDQASPEQWLASREAARDLGGSAPQVAVFKELLSRAHRRYTETPRMIANRAVQIEQMLRERGIDENARVIIEGLVTVGSDDRRRGFGEAGQHYYNMRATGMSRDRTLQVLAKASSETPH